MSHAFDTGLAKAQRTLIELGTLALLERLRYDSVAATGYLRTLTVSAIPILGREDDLGIDMLWDLVRGQTPAVVIHVGARSFTANGMGGYQWGGQVELHVYVISSHLRSREARVTADVVGLAVDTKDPGAATIMEHCLQLLAGPSLGYLPSIKRMSPQREEAIATTGDMILWDQTYSVPISNTLDSKRDVTQELVEIHARLYPQPGNTTPDPTAVLEATTTSEE